MFAPFHQLFIRHSNFPILSIFLLCSVPWGYLSGDIPVIGVPAPEFALLDVEMTTFMEANEISAGSLSVMSDGVIVFHHVYGWQDKEKQRPLRPDAMFRVASVTKPFTAAAIRKLIADGAIELDSKVFKLNGTNPDGILNHTPFFTYYPAENATVDSRLADITVEHLLLHKGGWDKDVSGISDYTYWGGTIAYLMNEASLDVASPAGRDQILRYIMGQPLQHAPGTTYAYANTGYLILGLIIEAVSGESYEDYVNTHVIAPSGGSTHDWILGRTLLENQDPREPYYHDPATPTWNIYDPDGIWDTDGPLVEVPYGAFDLEARTSQGRMVAHGSVILHYMNHFRISGSSIGGARPSPGTWKLNHTGSLSGTTSLARQRGDGINYALMFNKRSSGTSYSSTMRSNIDALFDSGSLTLPTTDVTALSPPNPDVAIDPGELHFNSETGRFYQLQKSPDLSEWEDTSQPVVGDGNSVTLPYEDTEDSMFYRFKILQ
ncbi:MAG: serine hydrolase domain-containing protein [Opitutaceae bacterium]